MGEATTPATMIFSRRCFRTGGRQVSTCTRAALLIGQKLQPEGGTIFQTKSLLAGALLRRAKYAKAKPLLSGYQGLGKQSGISGQSESSSRTNHCT